MFRIQTAILGIAVIVLSTLQGSDYETMAGKIVGNEAGYCERGGNASNAEMNDVALANVSIEYIANDSHFLIGVIRTEPLEYYYKIFAGETIFLEGTKFKNPPKIIEIEGTAIIRFFAGDGTNNWTLQYFNPLRKECSAVYHPITSYADYYDHDGKQLLLAVLEFDDDWNTVLSIYGVLREGEGDVLITRIKRSFISPMRQFGRLVFLNENEIYVDYEIVENASVEEFIYEGKGSVKQVREIIAFRS